MLTRTMSQSNQSGIDETFSLYLKEKKKGILKFKEYVHYILKKVYFDIYYIKL